MTKKTSEVLNKIIEEIKNNKKIHYMIIIIIGIILSSFLCRIQIRDSHDGSLHMLRLIGTYDTLKLGQLPPLVNQNYCNGLGYSMNLFYPPLVTYIPLLIKLFVPTYSVALKLFGAICIIFSGITMYNCVNQMTKNKMIALFAAIFYLIAPYKLANVYKRFAIGEFAAMVFIPLVFLGLYNLFKQDGKKHYYIAIGAIGLMLSHTVTTLYTLIFCIVFVLFNIKKLKNKEIIKKCIINIIFILLVSMLFWMPLLEATSKADYAIMNDGIMRTNGRFASENTISFTQLLKDKGEENGTTFLLGLPTIFAILLTIVAYKKINNEYKEIYLIFIIFSLISIFMASRFFPWKIMPGLLCKLQYPWRMLGYMTFFLSFVCAINLYTTIKYFVKKEILRSVLIVLFIIISIISSVHIMSQFFETDDKRDIDYENEILENRKISHLRINRDYMPTKAIKLQRTYVILREDRTYVLSGNGNISNEIKENLTDEMVVQNLTKDTILEFPYFYYVGYRITLNTDENIINLKPIESENGYLSCVINEDIEKAEIKVEYVGTVISKISYIISLVTLIIFIIYIVYQNKRGNKNDKN